MNDSIPPPKSAARTWLRILAWIIPGVAAPAILLGWFAVIYSSKMDEVPATIIAITLFGVLLLGCGFFNAVLRTPDPAAPPMSRTKSIVLSIVIFILLQVLLAPAIGYTVASGCNALNLL